MDFSNVQIVLKFDGWLIPNLDFKVVVFFSVNYLKNGTRYGTR